MRILLAAAMVFVMALGSPASAKGKHKKDAAEVFTLIEADALSVTVNIGKSSDGPKTFKITDATKITIDGVAAAARDLKGGMVAQIELGEDGLTALSIEARDPKDRHMPFRSH